MAWGQQAIASYLIAGSVNPGCFYSLGLLCPLCNPFRTYTALKLVVCLCYRELCSISLAPASVDTLRYSVEFKCTIWYIR